MGLTRRIAARIERRSGMPSGWAGSVPVGMSGWGGITLEADESRWTASSVAAQCVRAISSNAASLRLQVVADDGAEVEGHWLSQLWERPNPLLSRRILAEIIWARLETKGQQFTYVDRGESGTGTPSALWPIYTQVLPVILGLRVEDQLSGLATVRRELIGYQVEVPGGGKIGLLPEEVLWLRYPGPGEFSAMPPLEAAGHAVEMDAYARKWQQGEFKHGATPKHVIHLGDVSEAQFNQAVESWRSTVQGPHNAGKSLLTSGQGKASVDRLTSTPQEMSWLDTRGVNASEIMFAFGMPKDYLSGGTTYENRAAARSTLWSDTIIPKLEIVASEMTRQLLAREAPRRARFDTDEVDALQEGEDAKAKRVTDLTAHDVVLLDEARAEMGLDPLPNGLGQVTLTAYRTLLQSQAQAALLGDRAAQLPPVQPGRAAANVAALPLLLPSGRRVHGPSESEILAEYARHETLVAKAVGRLAARQQAVVLTNAERLFGGKSAKARAWHRNTMAAVMAYMAAGVAEGAEVGEDEVADAARAAIRAQVDDLFDSEHWHGETRKDLESPVGGAWYAGASQMAKSLSLDFDKLDLLVLTAMDGRLEQMAGQVTHTTRDVIESRILLKAVAEGESIDQIKTRIRGVFSDLSSWRAETIARTEVVGGFNGASHVVAESSGVVVENQWLATSDSRTRDTHKAINGDTVRGFASRFANGCRFPGDPTGAPAETIQCRCVLLYVTED